MTGRSVDDRLPRDEGFIVDINAFGVTTPVLVDRPEWATAQAIKVKISDRYSTYLLRDDITGEFRAADGSLHTIQTIIESGNQVTVVEP